jgi:hypothetical protein
MVGRARASQNTPTTIAPTRARAKIAATWALDARFDRKPEPIRRLPKLDRSKLAER